MRTTLPTLAVCGLLLIGCSDDGPGSGADAGMDSANDAFAELDSPLDDVPSADAPTDALPPIDTPSDAPSDAGASPDLSDVSLSIDGPTRGDTGEQLRLAIAPADAVASVRWNAGTQNVTTTENENDLLATWSAPGRYSVVAQVLLTDGSRASVATNITILPPDRFQPIASSSIDEHASDGRIAALNTDAGVVSIFARDVDTFYVLRRYRVCDTPRTLAWVGEDVWVTCQSSDQVARISASGETSTVNLDYGDRPFGIIHVGDDVWVTAQGSGELLRMDPESFEVVERYPLGDDARGIANLPDGRLLVSRWRALQTHSELYEFDPVDEAVSVWRIERDDQSASDTETPGVVGYLSAPMVSPWGDQIAVSGTQANIVDGLFLDGEALVFDTTLRAVIVFLDPDSGAETQARKLFDGRGLCAGGAWTPDGDYLGVPTRDARSVERLDRFSSASASGTLQDVGLAPEFMRWTRDGLYLLIDATLSRELVVYDADAFVTNAPPSERVPTVDSEPLSPQLLRGKILFNDSFDPRLTRDSYIACANCHLDGEADRLTWDFTDRGEGLRNTISLVGRAADHGPIHWSANFDEVQDFEHDIRGPFGGTGLMDDDDFNTGTRNETLGDSKAGVSEDLDALAAYVQSLVTYPRSPYRQGDGSLTAEALAGQQLFESEELGCTSCHGGARFTDSRFLESGEPQLRDVGTMTDASGGRLGGALPGIDTPTLLELFNSAPYLHDGSAAALRDVLETDGERVHDVGDDLQPDEFESLLAYLLSLDETSATTGEP